MRGGFSMFSFLLFLFFGGFFDFLFGGGKGGGKGFADDIFSCGNGGCGRYDIPVCLFPPPVVTSIPFCSATIISFESTD